MRHTIVVLSLVVTATSSVSPRVAKTCGVICPPGPPCEEVWKTPVIFAGRVTALLVEPGGQSPPDGLEEFRFRAKFAVTENFRGSDATEAELLLTGSTCEPNFQIGQSWLVYAVNREGQPGWTVAECTRTRLISQAAVDLAYLRLPDSEKGTSRVIGRVEHYVVDPASPRYPPPSNPLKGVRVRATDGTTASETVTQDDGTYSIRVPSNRDIDVSFGAVPGLQISGGANVRVSHWRGCAVVNGYVRYDSRISGSIVDTRGRPLPFFPLSLVVSPHFERSGMTDAAGRFEFSGVDPATYHVAPNRRLWSGDQALPELTPRPVVVGVSARVDAGRLVLPATLATALIDGLVVDEDNRPAPRAEVLIRLANSGSERIFADASGRFRVTVIAGQSYDLRGWMPGDGWTAGWQEAKTTVTAAAVTRVRLRLARSR